MNNQGISRKYMTRYERKEATLRAIKGLELVGYRATTYSIAKLLHIAPSTYLRGILDELRRENAIVLQTESMGNRGLRYLYYPNHAMYQRRLALDDLPF